MEWNEVIDAAEAWTEILAEPARLIKRAAAPVYTTGEVGYYCHPGTGQVGLFVTGDDPADLALTKEAVSPVASFLSHEPVVRLGLADLESPDGCWVKVAYSHTLRRLGELLNFFPGQYPGGLPNAPSPLAAMLTSGLVGAGLGWGAGRLAKTLLPEGYGDNLGRSGAILGGLAGVAPGAAWGAINLANDKSLVNEWPNNGPEKPPEERPAFSQAKLGSDLLGLLDEIELSPEFLGAVKLAGETMGVPYASQMPRTPLDVDVDAMGRTLWSSGASPQLAGSAMGALYAAQQFPDPRSRPGIVTANQLGQLTMNTMGNYRRGLSVGSILNAVVGTPYSASQLGIGAAALGLIGAAIPQLFG